VEELNSQFDEPNYGGPLDPLILDISDLELDYGDMDTLIEQAFADFKTDVYAKMVAMIEDYLNNNMVEDILLAILIHDESREDLDVWIELSEWPVCLQESLEYYEDIENYEECIRVKALQDLFNSKHPNLDQ
jgi:hypothetical protein